jgi:cobalt-zinc-cadmium efflux system protein
MRNIPRRESAMTQNHHHTRGASDTNLFVTMALNFFITIAEVIGGLYSGSLALISDAMHNFSDGIAITITYGALRLSDKPRSLKYTFGMKRAEIIAAIINASTLIIISVLLIKEAIERLYHPSPIGGWMMLVVALLGLAANVLGTILLKKGSAKNINLRAAYFHLLSDAISSLAVIIGAMCIMYFRIYWIDPVLTILISLYILKETFEIVKEAVDVVMMASPAAVDLHEVKSSIESIQQIKNIHHVHIWKLSDADTHFEAHIEVDNISVWETTEIQKRIEHVLHENYGIHHITLQFECDKCTAKSIV